jgi:hypothetical protein
VTVEVSASVVGVALLQPTNVKIKLVRMRIDRSLKKMEDFCRIPGEEWERMGLSPFGREWTFPVKWIITPDF